MVLYLISRFLNTRGDSLLTHSNVYFPHEPDTPILHTYSDPTRHPSNHGSA